MANRYWNFTNLPSADVAITFTVADPDVPGGPGSGAERIHLEATGAATFSNDLIPDGGGSAAVVVHDAGITKLTVYAVDRAGNRSASQPFTIARTTLN